jgi:hypothetical protein
MYVPVAPFCNKNNAESVWERDLGKYSEHYIHILTTNISFRVNDQGRNAETSRRRLGLLCSRTIAEVAFHARFVAWN